MVLLKKRALFPDSGNDGELLGSLLGQILGEKLTGCTLAVALDPIYFTSPVMTHINNLPHLRQVVLVRSALDFLKVVWGGALCRVYLFLFHQIQPLLSFADKDLRHWDYNAKYIVVGLTLKELETLTMTTKGGKSQHIVGIFKSQSAEVWHVYVNQLYSGPKLVLATTWSHSHVTRKADFFPDKISDLHGATLNVATFEFPPAIMYKRVKNQPPHLYGRDVEVVRALAAAGNFVINFIQVPLGEVWGQRLPNGSWDGLVGMLGRGVADIGIANLFITSLMGRTDFQHFSAPFHQAVNCVVMKVPPPVPRWQSLTWPFREDTWLAMLMGVFISGPLLYTLSRNSSRSLGKLPYLQSLPSSYLHVLAMHVREPVAKEPNTNASRLIVASLWIYTMILGICYSCNLIAFLTVTRQPPAIDTFKDLQQSDLQVVTLGPFFGNLMRSSENIYLKNLYKRAMIIPSNPESWVRKGHYVYINAYHSTQFMAAQVNSVYRRPMFRLMKECTWPFSVGVGLPSNSPLKPRIDQIINKIVESGLVDFWFQESVRIATQGQKKAEIGESDGSDDGSSTVPLNMDHMQGVFYIMSLNFLLAFLVFLTELARGGLRKLNQ